MIRTGLPSARDLDAVESERKTKEQTASVAGPVELAELGGFTDSPPVQVSTGRACVKCGSTEGVLIRPTKDGGDPLCEACGAEAWTELLKMRESDNLTDGWIGEQK